MSFCFVCSFSFIKLRMTWDWKLQKLRRKWKVDIYVSMVTCQTPSADKVMWYDQKAPEQQLNRTLWWDYFMNKFMIYLSQLAFDLFKSSLFCKSAASDGGSRISVLEKLKENKEKNCRNVFQMQKCFVSVDLQVTSDLWPLVNTLITLTVWSHQTLWGQFFYILYILIELFFLTTCNRAFFTVWCCYFK